MCIRDRVKRDQKYLHYADDGKLPAWSVATRETNRCQDDIEGQTWTRGSQMQSCRKAINVML